jgi:hypothetical protein
MLEPPLLLYPPTMLTDEAIILPLPLVVTAVELVESMNILHEGRVNEEPPLTLRAFEFAGLSA